MSPEGLANYLMYFAEENLIPGLKNPDLPISDLLSASHQSVLKDYIEWKTYYNWKTNNEWLEGGSVSQNDRTQFNQVLRDFLAISYSVGILFEKSGNYKPVLEVMVDVKSNNDSLDLESLIVDTVASEIIEEENVLNFERFGILIDYIKIPKNLDHLKSLLYTQTSDLVMEGPDNALKLAEILKSLKVLAEKVDYEIVEELVDKYIKVCNYSHQVLVEDAPPYDLYEKTNESDLRDSLGLLLDFPFDNESKEKFESLCNHYKPVKTEDPVLPVEVDPQTEKIKTILNSSIDWQSNNVDFIDSKEKITFGKYIVLPGVKKGLSVCRGFIKDKNGNLIPVAIKTTTDTDSIKKGDEVTFMALAQDHKTFLKLYGYYKYSDGVNKTSNIVMELAEKSLAHQIKEWNDDNFDISERKKKAFEYAEILIHGMEALNKKNISHRDLKPDNILITEDGQVKIADFDVSKTVKRDEYGATQMTQSVSFTGTENFVSPEMMRVGLKLVDGEKFNYNISDVYSLGLTILNMITSYLIKSWNNGDDLQTVINSVIDKACDPVTTENEGKLKKLLQLMLTVDHTKRPSFGELCSLFKRSEPTFKEEFN